MRDGNYGNCSARYCSQSCAACSYQRRKCGPTCPLAPYFPSHSVNSFLNARKIFGVKNIIKMLRNLTPDQKIHAAKTLIYEANTRVADPVGGSYRVVCQLRRQIEDCKSELHDVGHCLAICRAVEIPSSLDPLEHGLITQDSFDQQVFDERSIDKDCDGSW